MWREQIQKIHICITVTVLLTTQTAFILQAMGRILFPQVCGPLIGAGLGSTDGWHFLAVGSRDLLRDGGKMVKGSLNLLGSDLN